MLQLHYTPRARGDLLDIWLYIGADSSRAADRVLDAIYRRLGQLVDHPYSGLLREDIGPGIRHLVAGQYLAFYLLTAEAVVVLRVLHGRRQAEPEEIA